MKCPSCEMEWTPGNAVCECGAWLTKPSAASAGYVPTPGLISAVIRFDCIRNVGMVQDNNGDWVSVQNYCNLSIQLDNAVAEVTRLKMALHVIADDETDYPKQVAQKALRT